MSANGHFRAGKNSRVDVGAGPTHLTAESWDVDYHTDNLETINFECSGIDQGTIGILYVDWNLSANWDALQNKYDDPPGLFPRDNLGSVKFYENVSDNVFHSLPANRVISAKNSANVKDLVKFQASGKIQGTGYANPTGSV